MKDKIKNVVSAVVGVVAIALAFMKSKKMSAEKDKPAEEVPND